MIYINKILPIIVSPLGVIIFLLFFGIFRKKILPMLMALTLLIFFSLPIVSGHLIKILEQNLMEKIGMNVEIKNKKMSYRKFFSIYGHVRPNNYDLNSKNLQEEGREFIDFLIENLNNDKNQKVDTVNALTKIENYLKLQNYKFGIEEWYQLFQNSIISRENSKFMYSKAIDLTLNQIKNCDDLDKTNIENLNFEILLKTRKAFYEKESDH